MIRGRLTQVNQTILRSDTYADERARNLAEREFNLSTMQDLPALNKITAGRWYQDGSATEPEASVEEGIAKTLNLKLGDRLTFDVAGQMVSAKITSLRKLDWSSMRVNFFVVINPKAMQEMPQTWITSFYLNESDQKFVNQLMQDFPNLTIVDVGVMLRQLQTVLNQ